MLTMCLTLLRHLSNLMLPGAGVSVDINTMESGIFKAHFLRHLLEACPPLMPLVRVLKAWARSKGLNDPRSGTLNSYSLGLLCIFHLQALRAPQLPPLWWLMPRGSAEQRPPSHARPMHAGARAPDSALSNIRPAIAAWHMHAAAALDAAAPLPFDTLVQSFFIQTSAFAFHRLCGGSPAASLSTWAGGYEQRSNAPLPAASACASGGAEPCTILTLLQELLTALHSSWNGVTTAAQLPRAFWHLCATAEATLLSPEDANVLWTSCRGLGQGFEEEVEQAWRSEQQRAGVAGVNDESALTAFQAHLAVAVARAEAAAKASQKAAASATAPSSAQLAKKRRNAKSARGQRRAAAATERSAWGAAEGESVSPTQPPDAAMRSTPRHQEQQWGREDDMIIDVSDSDGSEIAAQLQAAADDTTPNPEGACTEICSPGEHSSYENHPKVNMASPKDEEPGPAAKDFVPKQTPDLQEVAAAAQAAAAAALGMAPPPPPARVPLEAASAAPPQLHTPLAPAVHTAEPGDADAPGAGAVAGALDSEAAGSSDGEGDSYSNESDLPATDAVEVDAGLVHESDSAAAVDNAAHDGDDEGVDAHKVRKHYALYVEDPFNEEDNAARSLRPEFLQRLVVETLLVALCGPSAFAQV
jgi:hypothetical protein